MALDEIRGSCPDCGDVLLDPWGMTLLPASDTATAARVLVFCCPACNRPFSCPVDGWLAMSLEEAGVRSLSDRSGPERVHPEGPPGGPPLSCDDLLDFHELLESDEWFTDLFALVVRRIAGNRWM
jgi:hypothetical protein